jgi:hypothetical protein
MELAVGALFLVILGLVVFVPHVTHGGFWLDDWSNASAYEFAAHPRYPNTVRSIEDYLGGRPLLALVLPIPHALFGMHSSLHLALALGLGILTSWSFFILLRTLHMPALHAAIISALALLFPWADSLRLWGTAGLNDIAVVLYLLGATLALHAFGTRGTRSTIAHGGSVALYVMSVLTYEAASIAALFTGALYFATGSRRRAMRRWAIDVAALLGVLLYSLVATSDARGVASLHDRTADVTKHVRQSVSLLASAIFPVDPGRNVKAVVLGLILATMLLAFRRRNDAVWDAYRPWFLALLASVIAIASTYVVFLGKGLYPLSPGRDNRINVFAALPWALLVYSILMIAAMLFCYRINRGTSSAAVAAALAMLIGIGYVAKVRHDAREWERASDLQQPVLAALRALPTIRPGTTIYTFGYPGQVAPEIYVFAKAYDLDGAARVVLDDGSVNAYPIIAPTQMSCGKTRIIPEGVHFGPDTSSAYGRTLFLDIPTTTFARIENRKACRTDLRRFKPGPASTDSA